MKEALLQGCGLRKSFPDTQGAVLDGVDVDIYAGDFTVVMGPSGAGKSTLLYVLSGMDGVTDGEVLFQNQRISGLPETEMARLRACSFGFVFQQTHLVSNLTLFENVAVAGYVARQRPPQEVERRALALLDHMGVGNAKDRYPAQVSGGEAQRAAIARAMVNEPGLLFADEPTGALNKASSQEVLDLLTALNRGGQSVLMVTHDVRAALRGSRVLYLEDGKLMDELTLEPYGPERAMEREAQLNAWLSALRW